MSLLAHSGLMDADRNEEQRLKWQQLHEASVARAEALAAKEARRLRRRRGTDPSKRKQPEELQPEIDTLTAEIQEIEEGLLAPLAHLKQKRAELTRLKNRQRARRRLLP